VGKNNENEKEKEKSSSGEKARKEMETVIVCELHSNVCRQ